MTKIVIPNPLPAPHRLGTAKKERDAFIAMLAKMKDEAARTRALQWYVDWLMAPRPKPIGRPRQVLDDLVKHDLIEAVLQERGGSVRAAIKEVLNGKGPAASIRAYEKAYQRHRSWFAYYQQK